MGDGDCLEALENFAEVLAILREWEEVERKETKNGDTNDAAGSCSAEGEAVD